MHSTALSFTANFSVENEKKNTISLEFHFFVCAFDWVAVKRCTHTLEFYWRRVWKKCKHKKYQNATITITIRECVCGNPIWEGSLENFVFPLQLFSSFASFFHAFVSTTTTSLQFSVTAKRNEKIQCTQSLLNSWSAIFVSFSTSYSRRSNAFSHVLHLFPFWPLFIWCERWRWPVWVQMCMCQNVLCVMSSLSFWHVNDEMNVWLSVQPKIDSIFVDLMVRFFQVNK